MLRYYSIHSCYIIFAIKKQYYFNNLISYFKEWTFSVLVMFLFVFCETSLFHFFGRYLYLHSSTVSSFEFYNFFLINISHFLFLLLYDVIYIFLLSSHLKCNIHSLPQNFKNIAGNWIFTM